MNRQEMKKQVDQLLATGEFESIKPLLLSYKEITEHDNDLAMTCYLSTIYEQEKAAGQAVVFSKVSSIEELLERYNVLKFYLRRMDFDVEEKEQEDFYQFLSQYQISSYELLRVMDFCVVHKDKVMRKIKGYDSDIQIHDAECEERRKESAEEEEICFIICTNNALYAQECIYYIDHLKVPDSIRVDILTIEQANSLTSAYNEAMQYSKAKYKVYLHQDTFIINPDFIQECLNIFRGNREIGLLGNVGVCTMPASGIMWDHDRFGMLYEQHIYETELLSNPIDPAREYLEVEAVDGFLMVTQYDIPWREDLFTGWDFYDCSQSMEFIRKGYKVVVPNMRSPWCVHDCGFINLERYDEEREKFVREYLQNRT